MFNDWRARIIREIYPGQIRQTLMHSYQIFDMCHLEHSECDAWNKYGFRGLNLTFLREKTIVAFNPIPVGVLENQDTLGESIWPLPPSKSHVWCPNMTNDISLESSWALLFWIFLCKIQLYSKNVCKKKFVQKIKNYTFLKSPWPCHFKYANILQNFK